MGVMFGGVTDEDTNEETLESVFWQDLYVPPDPVDVAIVNQLQKRLPVEREWAMDVFDPEETEKKN